MSVISPNGVESEVGRVVEAGEHETRMSDYSYYGMYAVILNPDGTYERLEGDLKATVDATPEEIEAYKAYRAAKRAKLKAEYEAMVAAREAEEERVKAKKAAERAAARAKNLEAESKVDVDKGDVVLVKSGKAKGKEGLVFWMGDSPRGTKLGVALSDDRDSRGFHKDVVWVLKKNVAKAA